MSEQEGGFGGALYKRLTDKGLSRGQIYKALALQRLAEDVARLGQEHELPEGLLIEISKIKNHTAQKQVLELVIERSLGGSWARELSRLIRLSEGLDTDEARSHVWDFFFKIRDHLAEEGSSRALMKKLKEFREALEDEGVQVPEVEVLDTEQERARKVVDFRPLNLAPGKGLDVGTANIVSSAKKVDDGKILYNIQRNAFLDMRDDKFTKKYLAKLSIEYTSHQSRLYVVGDPAFELANVFEKDARRPMKAGMISPYEPEALVIVDQLIHHLMGPPQAEGEICAFSVPASPIDLERDNIYHQGVLESLLTRNGYRPKAVLEGHAIIFAELAETGYTGIGISCGGGMFNICVSYKSIIASAFSTSRGGDWIDQSVGKAVGLAGSQVAGIKESGISVLRPKGRVEEAIAIYYRNLIRYTIDHIRRQIESSENMPEFAEPIPIVFAGGTSMIGDFIEITRQEVEKMRFPVEISDLRLAPDPLHTVAKGCLAAALQESAAVALGRSGPESKSPFKVDDLPKRAAVSRTTLEKLGALKKTEDEPTPTSVPLPPPPSKVEKPARSKPVPPSSPPPAPPAPEPKVENVASAVDLVEEDEEDEGPPPALDLLEAPKPAPAPIPKPPPPPTAEDEDAPLEEEEPLEEEDSLGELAKTITDPALKPVEEPEEEAEIAELDEEDEEAK